MRLVWGLIAAFAIMVVGFWPSFFSNPAQNDILHIVHGVLAAGWMLILIGQALLMARGHLKLHHWVGRLSPVWVAALLYTATRIVMFSVASTGERALPVPWRPVLTWIDLPSLVLFAGFYGAAIWFGFQRRIELHYRCMISTVMVIYAPALGRLLAPIFHGLMPALHPTFLIIEAVCVLLCIYDFIRYRKVYAPYVIAFAGLLAIELTMFDAIKVAPFMQLMRSMGYPG